MCPYKFLSLRDRHTGNAVLCHKSIPHLRLYYPQKEEGVGNNAVFLSV